MPTRTDDASSSPDAGPPATRIAAGHAAYRPWTLALYDAFVYGFSSPFLWRCPARTLNRLYEENVASRHLDVGVGTGRHLDLARFRCGSPRITLLDPNEDCLRHAARRIARYGPETVRHSAFDPLPALGRFGSIGMNYLLHCLPGSIPEKAVVFDRLAPALEPGGVLFGSTVLASDASCSWLARTFLRWFNRRRIFCNDRDRWEDLEAALRLRFRSVRLRRVGHVALFEVRVPMLGPARRATD